jgi:hypothetical protein
MRDRAFAKNKKKEAGTIPTARNMYALYELLPTPTLRKYHIGRTKIV